MKPNNLKSKSVQRRLAIQNEKKEWWEKYRTMPDGWNWEVDIEGIIAESSRRAKIEAWKEMKETFGLERGEVNDFGRGFNAAVRYAHQLINIKLADLEK
jgi:tRNA(Glu) U13 pseudouridine synthase TruD